MTCGRLVARRWPAGPVQTTSNLAGVLDARSAASLPIISTSTAALSARTMPPSRSGAAMGCFAKVSEYDCGRRKHATNPALQQIELRRDDFAD
jgi:hypothetical protein